MSAAPMLAGVATLLVIGGGRARWWARRVRRRLTPPPARRLAGRVAGRARPGRGHRHRRAGPDPVTSLPELLDLLGVAAAAGLPVGGALDAVAGRSPPPWSAAIADYQAVVADGALLVEALPALGQRCGESALPLVGVLGSALVDGDRLGPGLARLAADARDLRRRRAQEAAARLPVRLLAPLVACSLPAVAVLTIVPIVAGALEGLRLAP